MRICFGREFILVGFAMAATSISGVAEAQSITVDGRLSPAQTLGGPNYAIGADLGRQAGGNLFHSFGAFGLNRGETATFSGPPGVGNVIGRVTGGAASSIDGRIGSSIPGANLYLVNPAGVVFGPNASVDVSGSFHASSADYVRLRDGARFQATSPDAGTISAAPPEAFGFLSADPRPVTVDRSYLQAAPGRALGLVGGAVTISGGVLRAPAGTMHLASAGGPGEVPVDPRAGPAPTVARFGRVRVTSNALISVGDEAGGASGGSVFVRAGELSVSASDIVAENRNPGPGGVVSLRGDQVVAMGDQATVRASANGAGRGPDVRIETAAGGTVTLDAALVFASTFAAGDGGAASIDTGSLILRNGALLVSETEGRGNGGPVSIAADSVLLDRAAILSVTTGVGLVDERGAPAPSGSGGNISVTGGTLTIQNGRPFEVNIGNTDAAIAAVAFGSGAGGSVGVAMAGDVLLANRARILAYAAGDFRSRGGEPGSVAVAGRNITLRENAVIQSSAPRATRENAVTVTAAGDLVLASSEPGSFTAVEGRSFGSENGGGGSVLVTGQNVTLLGNSTVRSSTSPRGRGGAVTVRAQGDLTLDGRGSAEPPVIASEIGTEITSFSRRDRTPGAAGAVELSGGNIALVGNARVGSTNFIGGAGAVGDVTIKARDALTISQGASVSASTANASNAPVIRVTAREMTLADNGSILGVAASSLGGRGAEIVIDVTGALAVYGADPTPSAQAPPRRLVSDNGGDVTVSGDPNVVVGRATPGGTIEVLPRQSSSGILTPSRDSSSQITASSLEAGDAGNVTINAGALTLSRGGSINSATFGSGDAGSVALHVAGALSIDGAGSGRVASGVNSEAGDRSSGSAGAVRVNAGTVSVLEGGGISSAARGTGAGGSVLVATPGALLLDGRGAAGTQIAASAIGEQSAGAGTVTVRAGSVTVQGGARIASSTAGPGRGGNVTVGADSEMRLSGPGPQIAATAIGTGPAGSIAVSAPRLSLRDGASISTQAQSADGGNIAIGAGDLLYLQRSSITTSVSGGFGSGGNIIVDPRLVVLDRSFIQANAVGGDGGDVLIRADRLIQSTGSAVTATSQLGVSGGVFLTGPPLNLNGSLVVLASELRSAAALLREGCAARGAGPRSSLVAAGRGGQRQSPDATLPALYFANRPVRDGDPRVSDAPEDPTRTSVRLSGGCG